MRKLILFLTLALTALLNADVIKVGSILPLSGEYEFIGKAMVEGMQSSIKDAGITKHQYKIVFEDSEFKPGQTSLAAQKLVNVDHVDILTSMWGPEASAVGPISEYRKVPHVANDWDLKWTQSWKYTLDLAMPCDDYAQLQMKMLRRWGTHRVAFIYQNSADWVYAVPYFLDALKKDPSFTLVAEEKFNSPVRDFRTMLMRVEEAKPDIIVVWSIQPESEIILRQTRQLGVKTRFTGYYEDLDEKALGENMSFICFTNPDGAFLKTYKEKHGHEAPYSTNVGYDQMSCIIRTYEKFDKKPDSMTVVNTMKSLEPWAGASGIIRPRADRLIVMPMKIVKYQNGRMIDDPDFADLNKELGW